MNRGKTSRSRFALIDILAVKVEMAGAVWLKDDSAIGSPGVRILFRFRKAQSPALASLECDRMVADPSPGYSGTSHSRTTTTGLPSPDAEMPAAVSSVLISVSTTYIISIYGVN